MENRRHPMDTNSTDTEYRVYLERDGDVPILSGFYSDEALLDQLTEVFHAYPDQVVFVRKVTETLAMTARPMENGRRREIFNLDESDPRFQVWLSQKE